MPLAMFYVGSLYWTGEGVSQDEAKAMELLEEAFENMGVDGVNEKLYANWTDKNFESRKDKFPRIAEWFEKAAEAGNIDAMEALGYLYENGIGVAANSQKAKEWNDKAAEAKQN